MNNNIKEQIFNRLSLIIIFLLIKINIFNYFIGHTFKRDIVITHIVIIAILLYVLYVNINNKSVNCELRYLKIIEKLPKHKNSIKMWVILCFPYIILNLSYYISMTEYTRIYCFLFIELVSVGYIFNHIGIVLEFILSLFCNKYSVETFLGDIISIYILNKKNEINILGNEYLVKNVSVTDQIYYSKGE